MSSPISLEIKGKIAVITIDKQHKLNALTQDEYYEVAKYMREIAVNDDVTITVLTAKGRFNCVFLSYPSLSLTLSRPLLLCVSLTMRRS